jgi:hypothetical protein
MSDTNVVPDCEDHKRGFNLATGKYYCWVCGQDWDSLKSKKTLFCACFMVQGKQGWKADSLYWHANTLQDARLDFYNMENRVVREVVIAEVVGWLTEDEHGDVLSA